MDDDHDHDDPSSFFLEMIDSNPLLERHPWALTGHSSWLHRLLIAPTTSLIIKVPFSFLTPLELGPVAADTRPVLGFLNQSVCSLLSYIEHVYLAF